MQTQHKWIWVKRQTWERPAFKRPADIERSMGGSVTKFVRLSECISSKLKSQTENGKSSTDINQRELKWFAFCDKFWSKNEIFYYYFTTIDLTLTNKP